MHAPASLYASCNPLEYSVSCLRLSTKDATSYKFTMFRDVSSSRFTQQEVKLLILTCTPYKISGTRTEWEAFDKFRLFPRLIAFRKVGSVNEILRWKLKLLGVFRTRYNALLKKNATFEVYSFISHLKVSRKLIRNLTLHHCFLWNR